MSILEGTPDLSLDEAVQVAVDCFGLNVEDSKALPSERDQNFKLTTTDGQRFVLKVANAADQAAMLQAQTAMMACIAEHVGIAVRPVSGKVGQTLLQIARNGTDHFVRLVPFVAGTPLASIGFRSAHLVADLGRQVGQFRAALAAFDDPVFHRDFQWDLRNANKIVKEQLDRVEDETLSRRIRLLADRFERHASPYLDSLPKSVIHGDMNDGNVIVECDELSGVIDFGDAVYSWSIGELAIAIAYAVLGQSDPLSLAARMVTAHHAVCPLAENEIEVLFGLICMRLCVSAVIAAAQQRQRPDDPYLSVSQAPIRRTLPRLEDIPYKIATATFRKACEIPTADAALLDWLNNDDHGFHFPLKTTQAMPKLVVIDCSVSSTLLPSDLENTTTTEFTRAIFDHLAAEEADIGVGRYLEPRLIYTSDQFASVELGNEFDERRTIHLGIDLFASAGTPVVAPLDGIVELLETIDLPLDYGNLVVLRHEPEDGLRFFSLYGHLDRKTTQSLSVGQKVTAGEVFGRLGDEAENGGWPPHLHFQIITDLLDQKRNFPGVCAASQQDAWATLCPDPNLVLRLADLNCTFEDSKAKTLSERQKRVGSSLSIAYDEPLKIVRGWKHWLYDHTGRRYLDAYNNVPHVGHCHPRIVETLSTQARLINTNTRYLSDQLNEFTAKLVATLPEQLSVCFVLNSASEANELAIRLARAYTGHKDLIVLEGAYHGHSTTLIDISPYKHNGPGGSGPPDWVHTAPLPDLYRGKFRDPETAGAEYASAVEQMINRVKFDVGGISGFIAESCPSVGGQIILPKGYLHEVYSAVRTAGGVCIADEVQTGYGRLGSVFYGFELQNVVPDIVVLGKPIGNGHPLAAVITTREIADAFDNGMEFFSTFGGNNVSCAVGSAVLDVVKEEKLQTRAQETGTFLLAQCEQLQVRNSLVGDVRGSGLFLGLELVRNQETQEPADREARLVVNRMRELSILMGTDGPLNNVIKIRPPMTFGMDEAKTLVDGLKLCFDLG